MRFFKMEKCNFLKILQCPDFENLWGDFWHLSQPKKLDESDGGFSFLRIIFSSHVMIPNSQLPHLPIASVLDSIAVSLFADIFIELTNTVSDGKIQITILILRRGALSIIHCC